MQSIETVDVNFKIHTSIEKSDICFYPVLREPFSLHGLIYQNGQFRRMPEAVAKTVSSGVHYLHSNTSGGRVRFQTDSAYIAISAKMNNIGKMSHFALTGSAGFDLYVGSAFVTTFCPPFDITEGYESVFEFKDREMREITIHFPLYSDVCELHIGLQKDAALEAATPYKTQKPVIFYGSSITQGGCASHPGNAYPAILSRRYGFDFVNMGFSGNAKGEQEMAHYLAGLDMSMFVLDYDHNAPTLEHLEKTHFNLYKTVRATHPDIPIFIMSAVSKEWYRDHASQRWDVIFKTYQDAKNNGAICSFKVPHPFGKPILVPPTSATQAACVTDGLLFLLLSIRSCSKTVVYNLFV